MNKKKIIVFWLILFIIVFAIIIFFTNKDTTTQNRQSEIESGGPTSSCLNSLPITEISGPFTIKYLDKSEFGDVVQITDSSPSGREAALSKLRSLGCNISELNIVFSDFINPLTKTGNEGYQ